MLPEDIVEFTEKESKDRIRSYVDFFESSCDSEDPGFKLVRELFSSLSEKDREHFISFLRTVQIDTLGTVFNLLDNQAFPAEQSEDLELVHGQDKLNGDLTDILFEKQEE